MRRPAFTLAGLVSVGILIGRYAPVSLWGLEIAAACLVVSAFAFLWLKKIRIAAWVIAAIALFVGAMRGYETLRFVQSDHVVFAIGDSTQTLTGHLVKDPVVRRGRIDLWVKADSITTDRETRTASGLVLVTIRTDSSLLRYGDAVRVSGSLARPPGIRNPGGFDYRAYLALRGIHATMGVRPENIIRLDVPNQGNPFLRKIVYPFKRFAAGVIERTASSESKPILSALLLGDQGLIPSEIREVFSKTGVVHILSVSGSHVGFVLLILWIFCDCFRIREPFKTPFLIALLIFYAALTESNPPVIRAVIMAVVTLVSRRLERPLDPVHLIGSAGLVILLVDPAALFDLSFQFSFLSILSIVYFYRRLKTASIPNRIGKTFPNFPFGQAVWTTILVSLAAQIGTTPMTAFHFGWIPLVSIPANILAIPLTGAITAAGWCAVGISAVSPWLGSVYGAAADGLVRLLIRSTGFFERLPFSNIETRPPDVVWIGLYFAIVFLMFEWPKVRIRKRLLVLTFVLANVLVWRSVGSPDKLRWIQFDVRQADSGLLLMPGGHAVLVDAGGRNPYSDDGKRVILPVLRWLGVRKLNVVIVSHRHDDHTGGLRTLLSENAVREIILQLSPFRSGYMDSVLAMADSNRVPVRIVQDRDSLLFPNSRIDLLGPGPNARNENERSLLARIIFGNTRILFLGDAESAGHRINRGWTDSCEAVKIAHHGSKRSAEGGLLRTVGPKHAVISVGRNRFGHPATETISALRAVGTAVHRTDREAALWFESNGDSLIQIDWKKQESPLAVFLGLNRF